MPRRGHRVDFPKWITGRPLMGFTLACANRSHAKKRELSPAVGGPDGLDRNRYLIDRHRVSTNDLHC